MVIHSLRLSWSELSRDGGETPRKIAQFLDGSWTAEVSSRKGAGGVGGLVEGPDGGSQV